MSKIVFLPIGSYEQHGKLLPHITDSIICEYISGLVSASFHESVLLPTLNYGLSPEHRDIGNTITISFNAYSLFLQDVISSISKAFHECKLIVLINGHGGNQSIASAICANHNYCTETSKAMVIHVFPESTRILAQELIGGFNAHADSVETSVYAAISQQISNGVYNLSNHNDMKSQKGMLKFFPVKYFSRQGVVTTESDITVDDKIGEKLIRNSVNAIIEEIRIALKVIEEGDGE